MLLCNKEHWLRANNFVSITLWRPSLHRNDTNTIFPTFHFNFTYLPNCIFSFIFNMQIFYIYFSLPCYLRKKNTKLRSWKYFSLYTQLTSFFLPLVFLSVKFLFNIYFIFNFIFKLRTYILSFIFRKINLQNYVSLLY